MAQDQIAVTIPGDAIADGAEWMRGHGTYLGDEGYASSSVTGTVERVNRLISVKALRSRFRPEVGDLVVGRIVEVQLNRWKVDIGASQHASLALSAINLPGGVQRRKLEADELQMRAFFVEGDLVLAEVQMVMNDGGVNLHTRSLKYGKLKSGQLGFVPPSLVVRSKTHIHDLDCGISIIYGVNGWLWTYKTPSNHPAYDAAQKPVLLVTEKPMTIQQYRAKQAASQESNKRKAPQQQASQPAKKRSVFRDADQSPARDNSPAADDEVDVTATYSSLNENLDEAAVVNIARTLLIVSILSQAGIAVSIEILDHLVKASVGLVGNNIQEMWNRKGDLLKLVLD